MLRYYQVGEYDEWKTALCEDAHDPWAFASKVDASRVSIMAIEGDADIIGEENILYSGPLFFDIDYDSNLAKAIASGVELCAKLLSLGVDENDLEIHLSGSKGIHVFLDPRVFGTGTGEKNLPHIYKRMALDLFVPGMDMQVYSGKKGRLVRPPNSRRPDGKYKVEIDLGSLRNLTVEEYAERVSQPAKREKVSRPRKKSKILAGLYQTAKKVKDIYSPPKVTVVDDLAPLGGMTPPCVEELAKGKRSDSSNFNQLALNLACWSAKSGTQPVLLDSIHTRIVENCQSSKGENPTARKRKLQALHAYVSTDAANRYSFSCASMLSTISTRPCGECPIRVHLNQSGGIPQHLFIHEKGGQWYSDKDCTVVAATFTMERTAVIKNEAKNTIEASMLDLIVPAQGRLYKLDDFCESSWRSKNNFKQAIEGFDGAAFFGTDNDVARIRLTVAKNELLSGAELVEKFVSSNIGIIYRRRRGPASAIAPGHVGRFTYVEENFSINSSGVQNTHTYCGAEQPFPKLGMIEWNDPIREEANEAFSLLLESNLPSVIAPMLGWYLLAHIKTHVYEVEHRGALLCVSGVAGTGKNSLTAVLQRLAGLEGEDALHTLESPNSTKMSFQQSLSNTTTIPRIVNEMNPKSVSKSQYKDLLELLKAAFDSQSILKGTIGGNRSKRDANVSVVEWKITAPVVTLSEEPIHLPAVRQRAVMVDMTPAGHDYGAASFLKLERRADDLVDIAKILVKGALSTSVKDIHTRLQETRLPIEMETCGLPLRLKFGYQSILMAYDWAISVLEGDTGFSEDNLQGLRAMKDNFIEYMKENSQRISKDSNVTEVDKILKDWAIMAYSSSDARSAHFLEKARHYAMVDGTLYLDVLVIYPLYQRFKAGSPESLSIVSADAFLQMVRSMSYYITDKAITEWVSTPDRPVLALDVNKLQERDIPVTMFM